MAGAVSMKFIGTIFAGAVADGRGGPRISTMGIQNLEGKKNFTTKDLWHTSDHNLKLFKHTYALNDHIKWE